jgi:multiple sugar transport system ATP-binding protein
MNLRRAKITADGASIGGIAVPIARQVISCVDGADTVTIGIRPESFDIASGGPGLAMRVNLVEELGADSYAYGSVAGDDASEKPFVVRLAGRSSVRIGDVLTLQPRSDAIHVFDSESGLRIS